MTHSISNYVAMSDAPECHSEEVARNMPLGLFMNVNCELSASCLEAFILTFTRLHGEPDEEDLGVAESVFSERISEYHATASATRS